MFIELNEKELELINMYVTSDLEGTTINYDGWQSDIENNKYNNFVDIPIDELKTVIGLFKKLNKSKEIEDSSMHFSDYTEFHAGRCKE
jgi:hypothetical protein